MAITRFKDKATEDIFHGLPTSRARRLIHSNLHPLAKRLLQKLGAAGNLAEVKKFSGHHLEELRHEYAGWYAIRLTGRLRVIFHFDEMAGDAYDVHIFDYHP